MAVGPRQRAVRQYRGQIPSPGRPTVAWREDRVKFWAAIARRLSSEEAAAEIGVSPAVGTRWFLPTCSCCSRRRWARTFRWPSPEKEHWVITPRIFSVSSSSLTRVFGPGRTPGPHLGNAGDRSSTGERRSPGRPWREGYPSPRSPRPLLRRDREPPFFGHLLPNLVLERQLANLALGVSEAAVLLSAGLPAFQALLAGIG